MKLVVVLAASAVATGILATPALAMEDIHIPDTSAAQNSGPPDALFDRSVPDTWQKKSDDSQPSGNRNSGFSFSFGAGNGNTGGSSNGFVTNQQQPTGGQYREDASKPGSEFYDNGATVTLQPFGR